MVEFVRLEDRFARHASMPTHLGALPEPSGKAVGIGHCGDSIEVSLLVKGDRICDIRHLPCGCAFTIACGSAMSELALNRTLEQALEISPEDVETELGGLPENHLHCARLAVNTLGEAIADCFRRGSRTPSSPREKLKNADL
jgi:nitrogen fixation protein NifU and related proteins